MSVFHYLAEAVFFGFIVLVFFGGLLTVLARFLMHAVLGLAVAFVGLAGLFFHLGSPFMAMMQILIYVGAVCVMLVFGIMVGQAPTRTEQLGRRGNNQFLAVSTCSLGFVLVTATLVRTRWIAVSERIGDFSLQHLGESFLHQFVLAFELISVVLLVAIIGALIIARKPQETLES
ncbi:NADH-quinone oxidoreductase subunit J family protein [Geoalkalibacter halelectricus]|uniref:NADH-quinone oxidoreductase subunit J n=1 Tax=Geoalkalibacter halelectricus TaxID=2847045 RepID=A0ABY5ZN36_9BACT|nr:NADH-quinone oxidoreductase subunit J [Geoalkalibacter halelectricus]MDO3378640.1 NADH-quinone oxidoreductase subunit J [Geoalkalibacter halelectricus]UWZ80048.1 NADH-quinone oxidoreductase subunit J [Geoalkalibacter halelectricus]